MKKPQRIKNSNLKAKIQGFVKVDLDVYKQKDVDDNDPCIKITFLILNKNHGVEIHWMDDDTSGNNNLLKIIFQ